jgi:hypothetical protein
MKSPVNKIIFSIFFIVTTFSLPAQNSKTGDWFIFIGNQALSPKWNWWNEVQYRNYNLVGDLQQLVLRTGIGYNFTENNNNLLLGYGFIRSANYISNTDEKVNSNEHRIYQQFITKQNFGRLFLQHRYRLEERFFTNDFKLRGRYFLSLNLPLNHVAMVKNTIYLSVYNEIFMNSKSAIFDRNRLYGALGYVFNKNFKIELGFMAQTLERTNRNQFQIVLFNNLPIWHQEPPKN